MSSSTLKQRLRRLKWHIKTTGMRLIAGTTLVNKLASLFDSSIQGERKAALLGRVAFNENFTSAVGSTYSLRRDIHRLEKGLSYPLLKANFGSLYLGRVVTQIISRHENDTTYAESNEFAWGFSVLNRYFELVELTGPLVKIRDSFHQAFPKGTSSCKGSKNFPKPSGERPKIATTHEQFHQLAVRRRSVRTFLDQPVEKSIIEKAVASALQAPSACNRQPFRFYVLSNPDACASILTFFPGAQNFFQPLHTLIVVVGDLSAYQYIKDRHVIYTDSGLASMSLILALETLGLSSCCINWPDLPELNKGIAGALKLEAYERVVMGIAVGYPDDAGMVPNSLKKDLHEIIKWL